jgi:hypothetical protein
VVGGVYPGFGVQGLNSLASYAVNIAHMPELIPLGGAMLGAGAGVLVGLVQWWVLRERFTGALLWIPLHGGVAAFGLGLALLSFQPWTPLSGEFSVNLSDRVAEGVFLAFALSWLLGGAALAWGLRRPDQVAFAWLHDTPAGDNAGCGSDLRAAKESPDRPVATGLIVETR